MSTSPEYHPSPAQSDPRHSRRQGIPPTKQWTSPPSFTPDDPNHYDPQLHDPARQQDSGRGPSNMNPPLMRHQNRSVPAISTQGGPYAADENDEVPPLPPPYDPTGITDQFNVMSINRRPQSATSPYPSDPIPRAGTSMSMRSTQSPQRMIPPNGLPVSPDAVVRRHPPGRLDQALRSNSVHSGGSGNSGYNSVFSEGNDLLPYDTGIDTDVTSLYSFEDPNFQPGPQHGYNYPESAAGHGYAPNWHGHGPQPGYSMPPVAPPPNEFNPLYAAASNVLGMGPPPGPPPSAPLQYAPGPPSAPYPPGPAAAYPQQAPSAAAYSPQGPPPAQYPPQGPSSAQYPHQGPPPAQYPPQGPPPAQYPPPGPSATPYPPQGPPAGPSASPYPPSGPNQVPQQYYASTASLPLSSSQSAPYLGPGPYQTGPPSAYAGASQASLGGRPPSIAPSYNEEPELEMRPPLQRSGTMASVTLRTRKTKAIDLSAPPYTKDYIDQYRIRIKDDPDPEAHFLYAKYLIDAAKKIGADAKDQRSVRKYRDTLIAESLKVIRRLATQGEPYDEAQFFLANCHGTGMLGLQVDHERAYHLYLQAAKQNHAAACYRVAVCNEIGAGTRREPQRAAAFYRKAASLGDTAAMYKLGVILLRGSLGQQPNPREAVGWLKRAAEQADEENPHALHELALLHEAPNSQVVLHDPAYARELYTRAGHLGYTHSQFRLGQCYEFGTLTCPVDPRRSIAWYTKAAERGHSEAELALSGWYLTGSEGVLKQSDSEAYLWARRAANKGLSKAEYAVGYYAEVGIGIKQDVEFAKRWYMRAAAQGNKRAMNRLTEMKRNGNKRANMARPTRQEAKDECVIV